MSVIAQESYSFSTEIATQVGVNAAVIYRHIDFWCAKYAQNGEEDRFFDGKYWTYFSQRSLSEIYPWMSRQSARTAIQKLVDAGLVLSKPASDGRSKNANWYTSTRVAGWVKNNQGGGLKTTKGLVENNPPLTYYTDVFTDIYRSELLNALRGRALKKHSFLLDDRWPIFIELATRYHIDQLEDDDLASHHSTTLKDAKVVNSPLNMNGAQELYMISKDHDIETIKKVLRFIRDDLPRAGWGGWKAVVVSLANLRKKSRSNGARKIDNIITSMGIGSSRPQVRVYSYEEASKFCVDNNLSLMQTFEKREEGGWIKKTL